MKKIGAIMPLTLSRRGSGPEIDTGQTRIEQEQIMLTSAENGKHCPMVDIMTTLTIKRILDLYDAGKNYTEIAKSVGVAVSTVCKLCHKYDRPAQKLELVHKPTKIYFVYLRATDELLSIGTARECSDRLGIALSTFYSTVSRGQKQKKYEIFVEDIDGE